jgi:hypothetical protein
MIKPTSRMQTVSNRGAYISLRMPWLIVNQTRLPLPGAVPTPLLALLVQRGGIPGAPGGVMTLVGIVALEILRDGSDDSLDRAACRLIRVAISRNRKED